MLDDLRWVTGAETFSRLASIVTVPLLTRALTPDHYGVYRTVFVLFSFFFLVHGFLSVESILQKRLPELDRAQQAGLIVALALALAGALGVAVLALALLTHLSLLTLLSPAVQSFATTHGWLIALLFLATPLYRFCLATCRGLDRFGLFSALKFFRELSFLCVVVWLFWTSELTVELALLALLGANVLATGLGFVVIREWVLAIPAFDRLADQVRAIALPLAPRTLLKRAKNVAPDALVVAAFGTATFGAWAVLFAFVRVFQFVSSPFSRTLLPKISKRRSEGRDLGALVRRYYRFVVVLALPMVVGGSILGPRLITAVFGSGYVLAWPVIAVLFTAFGIQTVDTLSSRFFIGTDEARYETVSFALSTVALLVPVVLGTLVFDSLLLVAVGYLAENLTSFLFGLWYQHAVVDLSRPSFAVVAKVTLALGMMALSVVAIEPYASDMVRAVGAVAVGAVVYFGVLLLVGFVSEDDLSLLRRFVGA